MTIHFRESVDFLYALRLLDKSDLKGQFDESYRGLVLTFESKETTSAAWVLVKDHMTAPMWMD